MFSLVVLGVNVILLFKNVGGYFVVFIRSFLFQNYFTQYVSEFRRVVTNLREKCKAESTSVDSDDWTWFQHSLRVIQTCGMYSFSTIVFNNH